MPGKNWSQKVIPIPTSLKSLHHLSPDLSLQHWTRQGIHYIQDLLLGNKMKPFPLLQNEFNLTPTDLFSYIRVKHCIEALKLPLYTVHPKAWKYLATTSPERKGISLLYNILHQKFLFTKTSPHIHWENDLGHTYTENQWQQAIQSIYKATKCSALWELTQKLSLRWYLTPSKLAAFSSKTPDTCWRCTTTKGDLFHIMWKCDHIQKYWVNIFRVLSDISAQDITPRPELALLNLNIDTMPHHVRHVTTHILLLDRLAITFHWTNSWTGEPPLYMNWQWHLVVVT